jgi:hypothetical protein
MLQIILYGGFSINLPLGISHVIPAMHELLLEMDFTRFGFGLKGWWLVLFFLFNGKLVIFNIKNKSLNKK